MKKLIAVLVAACSVCMAFADPNDPHVAVVSVSQGFDSSRTVKIEYTLDEPAIVTFDVKTNGVSIGGANLKLAFGDVHRLVEAGPRTLFWPARDAWPDHSSRKDGKFSVTVTAWATNSPPDYMVIKLVGDDKGARTFYTAPEQLPGAGGVTNDLYKTDYLVMRRIPAAGKTFRMGSPASETEHKANEILHYVSLTNDFYMGVFKLTQAQFRNITTNFMGFAENGITATTTISHWYRQSDYVPTWPVDLYTYDAMRGTTKLWPGDGHDVADSSTLALLRNALGLPTLDLPTEAEWEFACRAGTLSALYDGTEMVYNSGHWLELGWVGDTVLHPVGLLKPNSYGLYDMYGTVHEWCLDYYADDSTYATEGSHVIAPQGPPSGSKRVIRSCEVRWTGSGTSVRSAFRTSDTSNATYEYIGYRLVCTF